MTRRPSRRRDRRAAPPPPAGRSSPTSPGTDSATPSAQPTKQSSSYGRAAIILALLLGTLGETAARRLPVEALGIFHFVVVLGIALIVAGAYRGFARRAVERSRARRRNR